LVSKPLLVTTLVAIALASVSTSYGGQAPAVRTACDPHEAPLFICETDRKDKYLAICAVEADVGKRWSSLQYRFGVEDRAEFVYPPDSRQGASRMFFSHVTEGTIYRVSVRFVSDGYTYRIESAGDSASAPVGDGAAGVTVTDAGGKKIADIACIERPMMFPSYLQRALACDKENSYGVAACADQPYTLPRKRPR
jgi:hypothetical protein